MIAIAPGEEGDSSLGSCRQMRTAWLAL